jgi:cell division protein FtsI (penicillin-binding protein 3)
MTVPKERDPRRVGRRNPQGTTEIPPRGPRRTGAGGTGRGGISEARAYTPRGRTVRETGPAAASDSDRPALRLIEGDGASEPPAGAKRASAAGKKAGSSGASEPPASAKRASAAGKKAGSSGSSEPPASAKRTSTTRTRRPADAATSARKKAGGQDALRKPATKPRARGNVEALKTQTAPLGARLRSKRAPAPPPRIFEPGKRMRIGTVVLLLVFVVLAGRMVQLQLTDGRAYAAAGLKDRLQTTVISAPRGSIIDQYGNVLAQSIDARYVYADPTHVVNPQQTALALRGVLGIPVSQLLPLLSHKTRPNGQPDEFEYLARGVDSDTADRVMALKLSGIRTAPDQTREEPGGDLAANLIGFTGSDGSGLGGLEAAYNTTLRGVDGKHTFEVGNGDLDTRLPGGYDETTPARPGTTLQLTIDRDLQYEVQQLLYQHMKSVKADWGAAIVMKVGTGEVMAQASYPTYDAQQWQNSPAANRVDAATGVTVDAGSVAKIITFSAALQEGLLKPDSTVTIGPSIKKGDTTFRDSHPQPKGTKITIPGILAYSSNVGTITVASELGADKLYQYQKALGFGASTNEGVPNESGGLVQPPANWSGSSYGSIPIGMGISVTPLQMTAAYGMLANNGVYTAPQLIKATVSPNGKTTPATKPESHRVISAANAQALRTAFEAVTGSDGTGYRAAIPGYRVAGKTGTGLQVKNGKYILGPVVSFVGMAPADNPQYVIGVFAHVPGGSGGADAAPAFHDMMMFTLQHFQVPPTGSKTPVFRLTVK